MATTVEATSVGGWSPTDILLGLPPQLQGVAVVVAAGVVGYLFYKKYFTHLRGDTPTATSTDYAVGDPTVFTDITPLKSLVRSADQLAKQMSQLVVIAEQHLTYLREKQDRDEVDSARREGFDAGLAARRPVRRRTSPRGTKTKSE